MFKPQVSVKESSAEEIVKTEKTVEPVFQEGEVDLSYAGNDGIMRAMSEAYENMMFIDNTLVAADKKEIKLTAESATDQYIGTYQEGVLNRLKELVETIATRIKTKSNGLIANLVVKIQKGAIGRLAAKYKTLKASGKPNKQALAGVKKVIPNHLPSLKNASSLKFAQLFKVLLPKVLKVFKAQPNAGMGDILKSLYGVSSLKELNKKFLDGLLGESAEREIAPYVAVALANADVLSGDANVIASTLTKLKEAHEANLEKVKSAITEQNASAMNKAIGYANTIFFYAFKAIRSVVLEVSKISLQIAICAYEAGKTAAKKEAEPAKKEEKEGAQESAEIKTQQEDVVQKAKDAITPVKWAIIASDSKDTKVKCQNAGLGAVFVKYLRSKENLKVKTFSFKNVGKALTFRSITAKVDEAAWNKVKNHKVDVYKIGSKFGNVLIRMLGTPYMLLGYAASIARTDQDKEKIKPFKSGITLADLAKLAKIDIKPLSADEKPANEDVILYQDEDTKSDDIFA